MSILNYLFDSEWSRRSDIEALKEQHSSLVSSLGLHQGIGELALLTKTLMRILVEKGVCTGREIEDMMHQVDLEDGSADGRVTKSGEAVPGRCPECDHLVQSHRERCLYCGHELSPDVREGTPDAEEVLIDLYDNATRGLLGQIPESQLHFLMDHLEVTAASDRDYYLDPATLVMLEERGAAEALVRGLRNALGEREGMEVRWEEAQESTGLLHEALEVARKRQIRLTRLSRMITTMTRCRSRLKELWRSPNRRRRLNPSPPTST